MVDKGPGTLSRDVRAALKMAACRLHLDRKDRVQLFSEVLDGIIQTDWNTQLVGSRSGVLFRAHVDCKDGIDFKVNFLLSVADLKQGAEFLKKLEDNSGSPWGTTTKPFPVSALYDFHDLRSGENRTIH